MISDWIHQRMVELPWATAGESEDPASKRFPRVGLRSPNSLPATHLLPRFPEAGSFEGFPAELDNMKPLQKSVIA